MFHPKFPFESQQLTYRTYEEGDKEWLFNLRQIEDAMRYVPFGGESWEEIGEVLTRRMALSKIENPGDGIMCLMREKDTGARVGEVMLRHPDELIDTGELGFVLHPDYQGRGYAYEGAKEMLRLGFEGAGFQRMVGLCDAANTASRSLMLRLGMREDTSLRDQLYEREERRDSIACVILAEDWRGQQMELGQGD